MVNKMGSVVIAVFAIFLLVNLGLGVYHGRNVKTIEDYALGGRNFSTSTLVSTIIATWIGGDYLFITTAEVYKTGIHYMIGCLGMVACLLLNAYVFVPRMRKFLGSVSVASAMGDLYGKNVRIITAISGALATSGFIAVQFKVFGWVLGVVGFHGNLPLILASLIVVVYSAFGGIKSVALTDVFQFITFGVLIPMLGIVLWVDCVGTHNVTLESIVTNDLFNYKNFIGLENPKFWSLVSLFVLFAMPDINPTMFQRVAIGRTVNQVKTAFAISAAFLFVILVGMSWIGVLVYSLNPDLEPNNLMQFIMDNYSNVWLKSFILIGVIAMCMSTADSNINSAAVLITHDLCSSLNVKVKNQLILSRITAMLLGSVSIYLALLDYDMLPLVFLMQSFYIPIVDVPLICAIMGMRPRVEAVLIAMAVSLASVFIWRTYFMDATGVDSILPASIVNFVVLLVSDYFLKLNHKNNLAN